MKEMERTLSLKHKLLLLIAFIVIFIEVAIAIYWRVEIFEWLSHNLWVVALPFVKILFKKLMLMKLLVFLKAVSVLVWHLSKLLLLKIFKTLGLRYGVFLLQNKWYFARKIKVMFLRRGRQFFRQVTAFWLCFLPLQKMVVLLAFFPVVIVLSILGLSFNMTRKTMVQKAQESAMAKVATKATLQNRNLRSLVERLDRSTLNKIKSIGQNKLN